MSNPAFDNLDLAQLAENLINYHGAEEIEKFLGQQDYTHYQNDPVEFCERELMMTLTDDVKKMMESVRDFAVTVALSGNGPGKTHGASATGIWFKKVFPGSQVITAAAPPESNLKLKLWGEIKKIIHANRPLFENYNEFELGLFQKDNPLSFMVGRTIPASGSTDERESKFAGHHAPFILFILDEGDAIPDEVYRAIDSCMSGGHCRLLVMFNPKRKSGEAYRKIREGRANVVRLDVLKHPNVVTGRDVIPGACSREKTVRRINEWTEKLTNREEPNAECFKVPKFLVGSQAKSDSGILYPPLEGGWRRIVVPSFYYMVLGQYPLAGTNQLISEDWYNKARSRWDLFHAQYGNLPPEGIKPILGMDVAAEGGDFNSICVRYGSFVKGFEKWRGIDLDLSYGRAVEHYVDYSAWKIVVEADGLGEGMPPRLKRTYYWHCEKCGKNFINKDVVHCPDCSTEQIKVEMAKKFLNVKSNKASEKPTKKSEMGDFFSMRDQLWWSLREWLRTDPAAALPPGENLREELLLPTFGEFHGKVKITSTDEFRKYLGHSPDEASSLIQTFEDTSRPRVRMIEYEK